MDEYGRIIIKINMYLFIVLVAIASILFSHALVQNTYQTVDKACIESGYDGGRRLGFMARQEEICYVYVTVTSEEMLTVEVSDERIS